MENIENISNEFFDKDGLIVKKENGLYNCTACVLTKDKHLSLIKKHYETKKHQQKIKEKNLRELSFHTNKKEENLRKCENIIQEVFDSNEEKNEETKHESLPLNFYQIPVENESSNKNIYCLNDYSKNVCAYAFFNVKLFTF